MARRAPHSGASQNGGHPARALVVGLDVPAGLAERLEIVGLLEEDSRTLNRMIAGVPVLGRPAALPGVLARLRSSGVEIGRIVVAVPLASLSGDSLRALGRIARVRRIAIEHHARGAVRPLSAADLAETRGRHWILRSGADGLLTGVAVVCLVPIAIVTALLAAAVGAGSMVARPQRRASDPLRAASIGTVAEAGAAKADPVGGR